jgi:hypothetical protein
VSLLEEYTEKEPKDYSDNVYAIAKYLLMLWDHLEDD